MLEISDVAIAAIITGLISLLGLIISKEQKISEFRQEWINALRSEISSLISRATAIHGGLVTNQPWDNMKSDYLGINEATANIRLRLNITEVESKEVLDKLEKLEKQFTPLGRIPNYEELDKLLNEITDEARIVLKNEWIRVKRGEYIYRITCLIWLIVIVSGIVYFL